MNAEPDRAYYLRQLMREVLDGSISNVEINIVPEPTNPFDCNAIAVWVSGVKIGYIGKDNQRYFDFSMRGSYTAQIIHWGITQNEQAVFIFIQPYF